ncbi:MAG: hypothetical protein R3B07_10830 [Polyangiaceae bacterium]
MVFVDELKRGVHGVTFEPGELEVLKDGERLAVFVHKETGALWAVRTHGVPVPLGR